MEPNVRKDKKKKKKQSIMESTSTSLVPVYNVESHYEARIADLKENNKILSQALDSSYKTISLQDKTIAELQKRLSTQMPKLLRVKLQVIGKTLKDLQELWDDTFSLVSDETAMSNLSIDTQEQRPNGDMTSLACNGIEKVSVGTQSRKKHKKKKEKHCIPSSSSSPSPQTFTNSNGIEVEEISHEGRSKSSSHKDRSKSSSKKRKMEQTSTAEQNVDVSNCGNEDVADLTTLRKDHVKKSKKNSKSKSESTKRKVGKLSVRIKPLKKPKKKYENQKKTSKKSWTVEYPHATIKVEPVDQPVENPSLRMKIPGRPIYSSSSDSSDTSTETEINAVTWTNNFPKGISPKVVLKDFMKEPEESCDPIVHRYRERILNEIRMRNNTEDKEEKIVPWRELDMYNGDDDPEQSVETTSCYEVQEAPESPDIDMFLSSSSKQNLMFDDDFCIGDTEHKTGLQELKLCNLEAAFESVVNQSHAIKRTIKTEGEERILIEEL